MKNTIKITAVILMIACLSMLLSAFSFANISEYNEHETSISSTYGKSEIQIKSSNYKSGSIETTIYTDDYMRFSVMLSCTTSNRYGNVIDYTPDGRIGCNSYNGMPYLSGRSLKVYFDSSNLSEGNINSKYTAFIVAEYTVYQPVSANVYDHWNAEYIYTVYVRDAYRNRVLSNWDPLEMY